LMALWSGRCLVPLGRARLLLWTSKNSSTLSQWSARTQTATRQPFARSNCTQRQMGSDQSCKATSTITRYLKTPTACISFAIGWCDSGERCCLIVVRGII
jgi:hypothetical protein